MYDADFDCIEQIVERSSKSKSETLVVPFALSANSGIANLYLTYDPNMSSLLKPLSDMQLSYQYPQSNFDYDLREALKVVEEREIEVTSLDELLRSKPEIPKPIFLSLDAQGSELEILRGAKETLHNVVAVLVEVAFVPIYENQPLFGEINEFLNLAGFTLMDIYKGVQTTNSRGPLGARAKGQLSWGDALFFKNPDNAERDSLAFCALAFGFSDFARDCLPIEKFTNPKLEKILKEFEKITIDLSQKLPPSFIDIYSESESKNRYIVKKFPDEVSRFTLLKKKLKEKERFIRTPLRIYRFVRRTFSLVKNICFRLKKRYEMVPLLKFAKKYGFADLQSELLKNLSN